MEYHHEEEKLDNALGIKKEKILRMKVLVKEFADNRPNLDKASEVVEFIEKEMKKLDDTDKILYAYFLYDFMEMMYSIQRQQLQQSIGQFIMDRMEQKGEGPQEEKENNNPMFS